MPVIRSGPAAGAPGSSAQAGSASASQAGRPQPTDDHRPPGRGHAPVARPTDANALLDKALEEVKVALAEQHLRTLNRLVRGLEALDRRGIERQQATQEFLKAGLLEVAGKVDGLRHEVHLIDRSTRRQIEELSARLDSAFDGMVEVLHHMVSEIAAIHHLLDTPQVEEGRTHSHWSPSDQEKSL